MKNQATNNNQIKLKFYQFAIYGWKCTIFLISFTIGSTILGKIIPSPEIPVVSSKLENFTKNKDKYNVVFIGSSRIYRHIVPTKFDRLMERQGKEIKSYNFGISSMFSLESYFFLEKILAMKPKNLEYIFIELSDIVLNIPEENLRTNRVIYWHTFKHTLWMYDVILDYQHLTRVKYGALKSHTIPLIHNLGNIGKIDGLIQWINKQGNQDNTTFDKQKNMVVENHDFNGYKALDELRSVEFQERRQDFLDNLDTYQKKVNLLSLPSDKVATINPTKLRITKALIKIIKDSGVTPIFIITPVLNKQEDLIALHKKGYVSTLFSFNNPTEYPNLYSPELRFDREHLNDKGAREFTKLLAGKFSEYLDRKQKN